MNKLEEELEFITNKVRQYVNGETPMEKELYRHWLDEFSAALTGIVTDRSQFLSNKIIVLKG